MGIEFTGGAQFTVTLPADQATQDTADKLRDAVSGSGIDNASSPIVTTQGSDGDRRCRPSPSPPMRPPRSPASSRRPPASPIATEAISQEEIGASWGKEVANGRVPVWSSS